MMRSLLLGAGLLMVTGETAMAAQGDWLVRLRGIVVSPTENTSGVMPDLTDASVEVDNAIVPELDFTYFLTDNIAAELILATSPHGINGTGIIADRGEVADVMVLPPTLTLQYHFMPNGAFRPYLGVGVNYTIFYSEDASDSLVDALGGATDVDLDDSFGVAFQAGVDVPINDRWFINADVKYIQIDTDATLTTGDTVRTIEVDLDPIVAGVGVGFRF